EFLTPVLHSYKRPVKILDINCGTGEDALQLSRLGHDVTATDGSARMVEKAKQKAPLLNEKSIRFDVCRFDELHMHYGHEKFDLIISNFGGLNCIDKNNIRK